MKSCPGGGGGYKDSNPRRSKNIESPDLKPRELTVYGLYFMSLLKFLKNIDFGGLGVVLKSKTTSKTTDFRGFSLIDL